MTEQRDEPERLDLHALAPTDAAAERVIGAVMAQVATRPIRAAPARAGVLEMVGEFTRPTWIAAAAALLTVGSALVVASRGDETTSIDTVAMWATQQHVPTNAELLLAFQGYQR